MKAVDWQRFFEEQRGAHNKILFTVTELANVAGTSRRALNVELSRLVDQRIVVHYAYGVYGPPANVSVEMLVAHLDTRAYVTGAWALHRHNLITEVPSRIACFTNRYSPRGRIRRTPVGRFVFVCVRSRVYSLPTENHLAGPEQALCDFVYLSRRQGVRASHQVTFRRLDSMDTDKLKSILPRYPATVRKEVRSVCREK